MSPEVVCRDNAAVKRRAPRPRSLGSAFASLLLHLKLEFVEAKGILGISLEADVVDAL